MKKVGWVERTPPISTEQYVEMELSGSPYTDGQETAAAIEAHLFLGTIGERREERIEHIPPEDLPAELRDRLQAMGAGSPSPQADDKRSKIASDLMGPEWLQEASALSYRPWEGDIQHFNPSTKYLLKDPETGEIITSLGPGGELDIKLLVEGKQYEVWEK